MSRKYKFNNPNGIYFVSFATVYWIDVFTRVDYKEILVESLQYCQKQKGLLLFAWVIMSNHVHLIIKAGGELTLPEILRDFKKYTSSQLLKAIAENDQESRREWMLEKFSEAGEANSNNARYQFWQQHNKPIEIYSEKVIAQKMDYLHANPVKAGWVDRAEDYVYSSARDYIGGNQGKIAIEYLAVYGE